MDEAALIKDAQQGDVKAYNTLVLHYQSQAFNVAYRIMGDDDSAADATQEAFISAFKHIGRFRGGSFRAWLLRIVTNACYDELRRRKRRPQASLDALLVEDYSHPSSQSPSPEQHAQQMELQRAIEECLRGLSDDHRIVTVLADVEGYSYMEIAEVVDVAVGTVKSRLSRARALMRDCLLGFGELLPSVYRH
jgi:RNA polymerase sigma-70 factor (ECF subfamily)